MSKLVECIPNFSCSKEKDEAAYNALVEVANSVPGCTPVSYTHLDVYKRQTVGCALPGPIFSGIICPHQRSRNGWPTTMCTTLSAPLSSSSAYTLSLIHIYT